MITISRANTRDIDAIAGFQMAMALESEGTILNKETVVRGVSAAVKDENKGIYIIAKENNLAIGSLMITREWSDWNNSWYFWIQSVYVMPEHRGKGIFKAMYAKVKELAEEHQASRIRLYVDKDNNTAQRIYARLGMEECHYLMYESNSQG